MTTCMHKVFRLLLAELRKLGCTIVYADFNQILLCTGKHSVPSAQVTHTHIRTLIRTTRPTRVIDVKVRGAPSGSRKPG